MTNCGGIFSIATQVTQLMIALVISNKGFSVKCALYTKHASSDVINQLLLRIQLLRMRPKFVFLTVSEDIVPVVQVSRLAEVAPVARGWRLSAEGGGWGQVIQASRDEAGATGGEAEDLGSLSSIQDLLCHSCVSIRYSQISKQRHR